MPLSRVIAVAYNSGSAICRIVFQTENHYDIVFRMENYSASLSGVFHALADPTRRSVISRLGRGPASIKELAEPFGLGLPSFLKHIKVLESSGLVESEKVGRVRTCKLRRGNLAAAEKWFDEQRAAWESRYENLDQLLITLKGKKDES
jgi:DNA-binding transcriptional ArsR family regulator